MSEQHTLEPWKKKQALAAFAPPGQERDFAIYSGANIIAEVFHKVGPNNYVPSEANARRIVACVNACERIPTEVLEGLASRPPPRVLPRGRSLRGASPS